MVGSPVGQGVAGGLAAGLNALGPLSGGAAGVMGITPRPQQPTNAAAAAMAAAAVAAMQQHQMQHHQQLHHSMQQQQPDCSGAVDAAGGAPQPSSQPLGASPAKGVAESAAVGNAVTTTTGAALPSLLPDSAAPGGSGTVG